MDIVSTIMEKKGDVLSEAWAEASDAEIIAYLSMTDMAPLIEKARKDIILVKQAKMIEAFVKEREESEDEDA